MRVAIFYNTAWYVYIFRRNLILRLQSRGAHVAAITPNDPYVEKVEALGVEHFSVNLTPHGKNILGEIRTILDTYRQLKRYRPTHVLSFTIKCNLYSGLCNYLIGFRQVANISGLGEAFERRGPLNALVKIVYRLALRRAHRVFFQNREDMELFLRLRLVPQRAATLLPGSGIDLSKFSPAIRIPEPGERRVLLIFGRLLPQKGYGLLLEAGRQLREEGRQDFEIWMLGKPDMERAQSRELYAAIQAADQAGEVTYLPPTDDVLPILNQAHAVVLPSTYNEGVPRSLLEALACGKPIITTDWKGCRETVVVGENGLLAKPHDQESLTSTLRTFLDLDPNRVAEMAHASRALAERKFDEQIVLNAYLDAVSA
jgi:glycosyltransferase involved in cell wall biosynthesis